MPYNATFKEVIHTITIYVEQEIDGKNIIKIGPGDSLCENGQKLFFKKEYYFNGDCFATVLPDCVIAAGPLEVVFEFYDKTDIFIHHFGQFLSPNSRSRVDVDKGKFVKIAVSSLTNYHQIFTNCLTISYVFIALVFVLSFSSKII
jgi:hypothetical protein